MAPLKDFCGGYRPPTLSKIHPDEGVITSVFQAYVFSLLPVPVTSEISEARPLAVEADASIVFLSTLILASDVVVFAATWLTAADKSEPPTLLIDMW